MRIPVAHERTNAFRGPRGINSLANEPRRESIRTSSGRYATKGTLPAKMERFIRRDSSHGAVLCALLVHHCALKQQYVSGWEIQGAISALRFPRSTGRVPRARRKSVERRDECSLNASSAPRTIVNHVVAKFDFVSRSLLVLEA